jgi:succinate-semialdehyde dehydrogenase/glutarate-semialdehyde dehydrogenase
LKCAGHIDFLLAKAPEWIEDEMLETENPIQIRSFVTHDPLGPVMDIVPWNFPFWMPFKSMTSPLLLGNPILLKHAPSTPLCAAAIEKLFEDAGFVDGELQNMYIDTDQAKLVLEDKRVRGVKFTGSTQGGKAVASIAGGAMKKGCFELGGSDPFVVLDDSNLELAVEKAYISRMVNNG